MGHGAWGMGHGAWGKGQNVGWVGPCEPSAALRPTQMRRCVNVETQQRCEGA
ncbi:hypothetical protein [Microcoleus sp. FACHB-68]|uniref:hypothetical protein n=1 Tax=Microcoleus sp. FACHB-68 TaxID=2692826 RepID=UPI00168979B8|nr:hypothetical protein [Microcoleus sp. FACHB-68]MBD1937261.1 hypothetical protein [Microcoleus sp. FACHB-68]